MSRIKIVALADAHYTSGNATPSGATRVGKFGDLLLLRAVRRINRFIKPDITLVLGDVVEDGSRSDLERVREVLGKLQTPYLLVPGNHDGAERVFGEVFGARPQVLDVRGFRFVAVRDPEQPGFNALRTADGFAQLRAARASHAGPIVAVQHVPVFPPGKVDLPYNYTNADAVIAAMRQEDIRWSISGHAHVGHDLCRDGALNFVVAPALCEAPFQFLEIDIDGDATQVKRHCFRLDPGLRLCDFHIHTRFAFCSENMDCAKAVELAGLFGLDRIAFTEHTEHLYFDRSNWRIIATSEDIFRDAGDRMRSVFPAYFEQLRPFLGRQVLAGAEIDIDMGGHGVLPPADAAKLDLRVGAMHNFPKGSAPADRPRIFMQLLQNCLEKNRFEILAHPLRLFPQYDAPVPPELYDPVIQLLKQHRVAAELNFHNHEPPAEFYVRCLEQGIKLSLGSDSHNLCTIGDFYPHLALLEKIGARSRLEHVLFQPPG